MELQHLIKHPHPLVPHGVRSDQSEYTFYCSGCEEEVSGPCFSCVECEFSLHKKCAEVPVEIDHPFHRDHRLILRLLSADDEERTVYCKLCGNKGKGFFYGCSSCEFYLDINCGLLPRDTNGNFIETLHVVHQHPLILIANGNNHLKFCACFGCPTSTLVDTSYVCFDCKISFYKKCVELPLEIDHPYHRKHRLTLEFASELRYCNLCEREHRGLFYCCSLCSVHIHNNCAWPPSIIEDKNHHEHPFTLQFRPNLFTCDACGTQGNNVFYICSTCNLQVHEKCISLPCIIRINLHHHPIYHIFFLRFGQHDSKTWDCRICYQKVNLQYGSYFCSQPDCDFVIHVNCAMKNRRLYDVIELKNQDEVEEYNRWIALYNKSKDCITCVIKEINVEGDVIAAEIKHISHGHNLIFSNEIVDNKHCNGCVLPISFSSSFYCCAQCDFFLHKACAELPREKLLWFDKNPFTLYTNSIFECQSCQYHFSGFSYKSNDVDVALCLRCATLSHSLTYQEHEAHHLFFDKKYQGHCSACGSDRKGVFFRCTDCNFALDVRCLTLPHTVWDKCDEHSLGLAYGDDNDYPLHHYCDICEEERDPKRWFYHCEVCDTAVHPNCVLGRYSFIKPGSNCTHQDHPHPLTFVQKIYDYPQCVKCGKPCVDLSLECAEHGCNYVVPWKCIKPSDYGGSDTDCSSDSDSDSASDNDSEE